MSRGLTILTACLVVLAHQANARLGETPGELETRYGGGAKTIDGPPGETALEYKCKDFLIMITFVDGKSAQEIYVHQGSKTELSDSEIQSFLDLNAFGKQWQKDPERPVWSLGASEPKDWIAMAAYFPKARHYLAPELGIMTIDYAKRHRYVPKDM